MEALLKTVAARPHVHRLPGAVGNRYHVLSQSLEVCLINHRFYKVTVELFGFWEKGIFVFDRKETDGHICG